MALSGAPGRAGPDVTGLPPGFRQLPGTTAPDSAAAELERLLRESGWLEARVSVIAGPGEVPGLAVIAGERARVERWQLVGNMAISSERLLRELPRGVPLARREMDRAAARVLRLYELQGYPLAAVFPRSVDSLGPRRYAVSLGVEEGGQVRLSFLEFAGAGTVSPRVLLRSAGFAPGPWQPRRIDAWQRNLDASGLVRTEARELVSEGGDYGLRFRVRPLRTNRAVGAVGYDADAGELTGFAHLGLRNIANTGRGLTLTWEGHRGRLRYGLDYLEPWLFGSSLCLNAVARHQSLDTTAGRTEFELGATFPAAPELDLWLGTGFEQVSGVDPGVSARTAWGAAGIRHDSRMPWVNPETGFLLGLRTKAGTRHGADGASFIGRVEADAGLAGPRLGRFVLDNRLQVRAVETPARLSELELYRLGGAATVRGYREDTYAARRLGWSNSELRYLVERNSAVHAFLDAGAAREPGGWRLPIGYGAGARVGTRAGAFSAAYGLAPGVPVLSGKLHFGYEGEF